MRSVYRLDVEELRVTMTNAVYTVTASSLEAAKRMAQNGYYDEREELIATELGVDIQDVTEETPDDDYSITLAVPPQYCVYVLWGDDDQPPVYVGQSTNVLARIGTHMTDPEKRTRTTSIEVIPCMSQEEMTNKERELIESLEPQLNIAHNSSDALMRQGFELRPVKVVNR